MRFDRDLYHKLPLYPAPGTRLLVDLVPHLPRIVIPTHFLEHEIFYDRMGLCRFSLYRLALLGEHLEFLEQRRFVYDLRMLKGHSPA
jgi:hypothetical protein